LVEQLYFRFDDVFGNQEFPSIYDVIIGDYNRNLMGHLFNNDKWLNNCIYIHGRGVLGKTFMCNTFVLNHGGVNLFLNEDLDAISELIHSNKMFLLDNLTPLNAKQEEKLFYVYNMVLANSKTLIINSVCSIDELNLSLPDLKSRLNSANIFYLKPIDDNLLKVIFFKMLLDRQIMISKPIINLIFNKVDRNLESLIEVKNKIENFVMKENKGVSLKNINNILNN
jgi:chromosomal replication initiation ATPase DnaA